MSKKVISFLLYSIVNYIEESTDFKLSNNSSGVTCSLLKTVKKLFKTGSSFL